MFKASRPHSTLRRTQDVAGPQPRLPGAGEIPGRGPCRAGIAYRAITNAVAERVTPPDVPLKVNVYSPDAVPAGNVMVAFASADEPPTLTDAGLIAQVAPCGPLQVSATL